MMQNFLCILPRSIRNWSAEGTALGKITANVGWLMSEYICRLEIGLVVSVLVARHLGPHDFGILSYALSVTTFLGTFVYLGLGGIVVRDIVKDPNESGLLMGSAFALKMTGACIGYALILIFAFWGCSSNVEAQVLLIVGGALFFRPMEIINIWFQSRTESKYSVWSKAITFFLASAGKLFLVLAGASVVAFASLSLTEFVLAAILLLAVYAYTGQTVRSWTIHVPKMLGLLKQSWVLILGRYSLLIT
jgi:PST family polysaccharide transporter